MAIVVQVLRSRVLLIIIIIIIIILLLLLLLLLLLVITYALFSLFMFSHTRINLKCAATVC